MNTIIGTAPLDRPSDPVIPTALEDPNGGRERPAELEAFGELGPVLVGAFVLWLAIVVAVATAV